MFYTFQALDFTRNMFMNKPRIDCFNLLLQFIAM